MSNADKLLFRSNLSPETIAVMKEFRKEAYALAQIIDSYGTSAELTLAFRHLQECQFFVNAHLCYVDPNAVKEPLIGDEQ